MTPFFAVFSFAFFALSSAVQYEVKVIDMKKVPKGSKDVSVNVFGYLNDNQKESYSTSEQNPRKGKIVWQETFTFDGEYDEFAFKVNGTHCNSVMTFIDVKEMECGYIYAQKMRLGKKRLFVEFTKSECTENKVGLYGNYPGHAGNVQNQQIGLNSNINRDNVHNVKQRCFYNDTMSHDFQGYITVDKNNFAYWMARDAATIMCMDTSTCSIEWSWNILENLGLEMFKMTSKSSFALFQNDKGEKGLIFGYLLQPFKTEPLPANIDSNSLNVAALNIETQQLMWDTRIVNASRETSDLQYHGVIIEGQYAYSGISSSANMGVPPIPTNLWRGIAFKMNINTGELLKTFKTLPDYPEDEDALARDGWYMGASVWPQGGVIGDYYVFGTGQLYTYPKRVGECMMGNFSAIPIGDAHSKNTCGEDMSDVNHWRCFEEGILSDSLVILDKHTLELVKSVPMYGVDAWGALCAGLDLMTEEQQYQFVLWSAGVDGNEELARYYLDNIKCPTYVGPDADHVAVALYEHENEYYVALAGKDGMFHIIAVPSGEVKVAKKVGPSKESGGTSPFSMAVDEENMIAIYSFRGYENANYKYELADGTVVCDAGSIHAIDLKTGYTLWQWKNPYGLEDPNCDDRAIGGLETLTGIYGTCETDGDCYLSGRCQLGDCIVTRFQGFNYDGTGEKDEDCEEYETKFAEEYMFCDNGFCALTSEGIYKLYHDPTVEGQCERAFDGSAMKKPSIDDGVRVVTPPIDDLRDPSGKVERALNIGQVTISNEMVYIPTSTGEVYIHDLMTGEYLNKLSCPDYEQEVDGEKVWNREGVRTGVTIAEDLILFQCGSTWHHPGEQMESPARQSQIIVGAVCS